MNPKNKLSSIADRIKYLLMEEGISIHDFCKQEGLLNKRRNFEYQINKGKGDNVSAIYINKIYNRYKNKASMIWLMTGDDDKTVTHYLNRIQELENEKMTVSEIFKTSYAEIKNIVDKAEAKAGGNKK